MKYFQAKGTNVIVAAATAAEASEKYKVLAMNSKLRDQLDNLIYEAGFRVDEYNVGDKNTSYVENNYLKQDYAKVVIVYEGVNSWKVGIAIPDQEDVFNTKVTLSKKSYSDAELGDKMKELAKSMKNMEAEYKKMINDYNKKLKGLV